ncbi:MAG: hypothetical protein ABW187_09530 [Dokdonella sp.]
MFDQQQDQVEHLRFEFNLPLSSKQPPLGREQQVAGEAIASDEPGLRGRRVGAGWQGRFVLGIALAVAHLVALSHLRTVT